MNTPAIEVSIWGKRVGAVAPHPTLRCYSFEYEPSWRRSAVELAPLLMPLSDPTGIFQFPDLPASFAGLPGMLVDALPDAFGNSLIDAWMAQRGITKGAVTALDRLAYMGKRGMGALEFRPARGAQTESKVPLEMAALVEAARDVVHGRLEGDAHAKAALANIIRVGTSAGGARAKAVIAWNPTTREIRSGQFNVAEGFEHWLLKFDGVGKDLQLGDTGNYGRIEYAYSLMATAAGVTMSECQLFKENGRAHFMTKRFDREGNVKHHVQSLCAMQHLDFQQIRTHAYEQLFLTIAQLRLGDAAIEQAFRRMVFNVIARNCDDHTKNFGFRLRQAGRWELAPAYDVTHAYNPTNKWIAAHLMSVNGKFEDITRADLLTIAERFLVPGAKKIIDEISAVVRQWKQYAAQAEVPDVSITDIEKDFVFV